MGIKLTEDQLKNIDDKDWLTEMYMSEKMSLREIAKKVGCSHHTVKHYLKKHDIPIKTRKESIHLNTDYDTRIDDKDWLYDMYINKHMTMSDIADYCKVAVATIQQRFIKFSIPSRSSYESRNNHKGLILLRDKKFVIYKFKEHNEQLKSAALELGVHYETLRKYLKDYGYEFSDTNSSDGEREVRNFVSNFYDGEIITNDRNIISPYELDIVLPEINVAIEYCGVYWHSSNFVKRNYHKEKLEKCEKLGYRLITIFEDEWEDKNELVKSKILHIINKSFEKRIYARNCVIKQIGSGVRKDFMKKHHIQGDVVSSINYGLFHNDELVSVTSFKNMKNGVFDLSRYASKYHIIGGFSKLLTHFKRNNQWNEIYTFADRRWSDGNMYFVNGFEHVYNTSPNYSYIKHGKKYSRQQFMKHMLERKLDVYDANMSEKENMESNGFYRLYDCGNMKFLLKNK